MCVSLVQKTIVINWRPPRMARAAGHAYIDVRGVINIDIYPDQSVEKLYETALHEVAHCLAGHVQSVPRMELPPEFEELYLQIGPLFERSDREWEEHSRHPWELEAEQIRRDLDHFAKKQSLDKFGNDEIENRMLILSELRILQPEERS